MAFASMSQQGFRHGDTNESLRLEDRSDSSNDSVTSPQEPTFDQSQADIDGHNQSSRGGTPPQMPPVSRFNRVARVPPSTTNGRGGFRSSSTWVSRDTKEYQEYLVIRNAMRRLFKNSEVAHMKYVDYIAHREAMVAAQKAKLSRKLESREKKGSGPAITDLLSLHPELFEGNFSTALRLPTIWCLDWATGKDEIAPWPTLAEMKWEGDDRAKTGVGRFLPLPREMGAPGISWNQLQAIEQFELDKTCLIPDMEDVYLPVDQIDDSVKYDLITKELEEALENPLDY